MYGSFLKKETNEDSRSKQRNLIQGIKRRGSNEREEITEIKLWNIDIKNDQKQEIEN